jgi:hypothetical protein
MTGDDQSPVASPRHPPTAAQRRNVQRAERVIGLAAPFLDLLLAVGDRISRIAEPEDHEYYPVRTEGMPQPEGRAGDEQPGGGAGDRRQGESAGD